MKRLILIITILIFSLNIHSQQKDLERDGIYIVEPNVNFSINYNQKLYILTEDKMQKILKSDFIAEITYYKNMLNLYEDRVSFLEAHQKSLDETYQHEIQLWQIKYDMEMKLRIDFENRYNLLEKRSKITVYGMTISISVAVVGIGCSVLFGYLAFR